MRNLTRIASVFAMEAVVFFLLTLTSFVGFAAARGVDPREGGFLFVSPLAILVVFLMVVAAIYGSISGVVVNLVWGRATRSARSLLAISAAAGGTFASLWMLVRYLESVQLKTSGEFLTIDTLWMFLFFLGFATAYEYHYRARPGEVA